MFGEVYDGNPAKMGEYTYRHDWPQERGPCLDSLLNFQFCFAARSFLRTDGRAFGKASGLENAFRSLLPTLPAGASRPYYNPTPGSDGLNSEQKMVNFIENHDGLNRFRVRGISERRNLLADGLLLTSPGIPCLYYGTEAGLEDTQGKIGTDSETGRLTLVRAGDRQRLDTLRNGVSFKAIAAICALRRQFPALVSGETNSLWVDSDASESDDGVFAFARSGEGLEPIVVVINASDKPRLTGGDGQCMKLVSTDGKPLLLPGDKLQRIPVEGLDTANHGSNEVPGIHWVGQVPEVQIHVLPESISLFRRVH